jgi:hypothetical protein
MYRGYKVVYALLLCSCLQYIVLRLTGLAWWRSPVTYGLKATIDRGVLIPHVGDYHNNQFVSTYLLNSIFLRGIILGTQTN